MPRLISLFDVQPIMGALAAGQLILTPNQRLASRIRTAYAITCSEQGQKVVETPAVYSLTQWVDRCWQRLLINAQPLAMQLKPLSSNQEQALWEQIVASSDLGTVLLRPSATAQQAASAYRSLVEWRQPLASDDASAQALRDMFAADDDSAALLEWIDQFEARCSAEGWLPSVRRAERVLAAFNTGMLAPEGALLGIGFEEIPPLQQALLDSAGTFVHYDDGRQAGSVAVVECDSAKQELLAAAVWAKQVLKNDPAANVALVIPDLTQQRQAVQRVLLEVFEPSYNAPLTDSGEVNGRRNMPFNFSAGYPLSEAPIIVAAINALSLGFQSQPLGHQSLDIDMLAAICQSPFYCLQDDDQEAANRLLVLLRDERAFVISSARFRQLAATITQGFHQQGDESPDDSPWHFAEALQQHATLCRGCSINKPREARQWLPVFQDLLIAMGWPGQRTLDSIEYQQVTQWQQALNEFAGLDWVSGPLSFNEAVSQLRSILSRQIFQPQTADSSLQILGTLEAAGLQFSHLWLLSLSEQQWPPSPSPNPLLPYSLQRQLHMPHASAERELHYAKNLTQRFIHSADQIVVSAAMVIDDNPASVSSLFNDYQRKPLSDVLGRSLDNLVPLIEIRRRHFESQSLEPFDAGDAPVLAADETMKGGSSLLASQSACPFKAFANYRLGLKTLAEPELGLNAADRGSLLHRALELVWQKLKNQQALLALNEEQQDSLCHETSQYAVSEIAQRKPSRLGSRYQALETTRLQHLLNAWLQVERNRANFSIESIESRKTFRFEGLELQTRIDRIDRLDDYSVVIIDYKTGNSSISRWWGERPDEPQMPLYGMLSNDEETIVGGIAFAQVRVDGCALKGVGAQHLPEPIIAWKDKIKTDAGVIDWPQLQQHWRKVLSALARDFIAGKADVDPKQTPQSCQYCDLASVCRINHREVQSA